MKLWTPEERLNYIYAFMKYDNKDIELDFWQDDFIKNKSRFISLLKSRQTGFSFIVAIKGLVKALDPARTKYTKQFVSYNEDDAQEKIRYAKEIYDSIPNKYKKKLIKDNSRMLEFEDVGGNTTSRLISLPCRPPRGKNGDVCLDEFAIYLPRLSKQIYTAASFGTVRRGCIEVGSTPLGTIGKFYELCTNKENYPFFDRYFIPWWYSQAMCKDIEKALVLAKDMDTEERVLTFGNDTLINLYKNSLLEDFQQECECSFIDSAASYISLDLIFQNTPGKREEDVPFNITDDEEYFEANRDIEIRIFNSVDDIIANYNSTIHGSPLFMGYDVAKNRDASAFYILGMLNGKKRSVMRIEKTNMNFEDQKNTVRKLMRNLPVFRCCIDCTGMGAPIYEELQKEFGDRIEGINFTIQSKEVLAMGVKFGLEKEEFLLENDRGFHAQIHSIKRTPSTGGSFRYDSERNESGHADGFWALALANLAASKTKSNSNFYSEYARKKNKSVVEYNNEKNSNNTTSDLTVRRGKPLGSVLRRVSRAHN